MARPKGLRLSTTRHAWYRIDWQSPSRWNWTPHPIPLSRFDSAAGARRLRYAGDASRVAMRERFDTAPRKIRPADLDLHLIELTGSVEVLDLRRNQTLDALGLDDQINTGRAAGVWSACQQLSDRVHDWFGTRCHGVVYRSRTTPQSSANLAFFAHAPLTPRDLGTLREQEALLASAVVSDGFSIQGWR